MLPSSLNKSIYSIIKIFCCILVETEPFSLQTHNSHSIFNSAQSFRTCNGMSKSCGQILGMRCAEFTLFYPLFIEFNLFSRGKWTSIQTLWFNCPYQNFRRDQIRAMIASQCLDELLPCNGLIFIKAFVYFIFLNFHSNGGCQTTLRSC